MDILWAISNPQASQTLSSEPDEVYEDPYASYSSPTSSPRKLRRQSSGFGSAPATTTYADGSWEMYEDFVGGVQFWGYALASGTGDGCVRMWDSESCVQSTRKEQLADFLSLFQCGRDRRIELSLATRRL